MVGHRVELHGAAAMAGVIFEPATQRVESIAHGDMRILMRVVHAAVAADDNLAPGNHEINADLEQIALTVAWVLTLAP